MSQPIPKFSSDSLPWDRFGNPAALTEAATREHPLIVIGAGLAGCWLARLLAEDGMSVRVFEARSKPGAAASGNPAGMVKPFVTRNPGYAMDFYLTAHAFLRKQLKLLALEDACGYTPCGVAQLVNKPYPACSHYRCLDEIDTNNQTATTVNAKSIFFDNAGWLNPSRLCTALLQHPRITIETDTPASSITAVRSGQQRVRWQLTGKNKVFQSSHVVIASGVSLNDTELTANLPIIPARGQISRFNYQPNAQRISSIVNGKHYVIPNGDSILVGATFERDCQDEAVTSNDNKNNRDGLKSLLPELAIDSKPAAGYAGVRATTPDRLPVVGPLPDYGRCLAAYADLHFGRSLDRYPDLPVHDGLYVLGGFGSRGITTTPLAAALLASHLSNPQSTDPGFGTLQHWAPLLNPARFQIRALKRQTP